MIRSHRAPVASALLAGLLALASGAATAAPVIAVTPATLDFGSALVDTVRARVATVRNNGDAPLVVGTLTAPATGGIAVENGCTQPVAPAGTCTVTVTATVGPARFATGTVTLASNGSATPVAVGLTSGYGSGYAWSGHVIFGPTVVGATATQSVTLTNTRADPLVIDAVEVAEALTSRFTVTGNCVGTVAPAGTCSLAFTYSPVIDGLTEQAVLRISASASGPALLLAGTGIDAALDTDGDGMPNYVESEERTDSLVKDNDVFASSRLFARQQYRDFLAREGDEPGIADWSLQIDGGKARSAVIEGFFAAAEFQDVAASVTRLYFAYFLRAPDTEGLLYWIGQRRLEVPLATISQFFAQSAEFVSLYGALDDTQFVTLVYQNVLGRAPDPEGLAYWLNLLATTHTRGMVMTGFSESPEYAALIANEVTVTMTYTGMLRRAPDPAGFSFWVTQLDGGAPHGVLLEGVLASPEYRARFLP